MPQVPNLDIPQPPQRKKTTFYCFRKGASEKDKLHDIAQIEKFMEWREQGARLLKKRQVRPKCYDCRKPCIKGYGYIDIKSEDGNEMRVAIHNICHKRAVDGGSL